MRRVVKWAVGMAVLWVAPTDDTMVAWRVAYLVALTACRQVDVSVAPRAGWMDDLTAEMSVVLMAAMTAVLLECDWVAWTGLESAELWVASMVSLMAAP